MSDRAVVSEGERPASSPPDIAEAIGDLERAIVADEASGSYPMYRAAARSKLENLFRQQQEEIEQSHRDTIYFSAEAGRFANALASLQREQLTESEAAALWQVLQLRTVIRTPLLIRAEAKLRARSISSETI